MNRKMTNVLALLAISGGLSATAQQAAAEKPKFEADGTVEVPAFKLPPSVFMSREAVDQLKSRANADAGVVASFGSNITDMRANVERRMEPMVAAARKRYEVDISPQEFAGVKTLVVTPKSGEADSKRILINLHGGAFMMCAHNCAIVESVPIAAIGRIKVVTVDYRQGPESVFPAATEDAIGVYKELLKSHKAENIGIYGCSAGGVLTAEVEAWILDKGLPSPGALGIFGAGAAKGGTGDSAYIAGYIDGAFSPPRPDGSPAMQAPYFKGADMDSALVAPAGYPNTLAKFPPTLIVTGTRAPDLSSAVYTHSQLTKAGARGNLIVGEGMGHCYINNSELPESRDTYEIIAKFFKDNLGSHLNAKMH
jgi:epsilon-lactone hydrolase